MQDEHPYLLDAVEAIDPTRCSYEEWVEVGMALHESGFACDDWDAWSARDASRYHEGECARKWVGFGSGMGDHVTSGSIIEMAERAGWVQPGSGVGAAIGWDDDVTIGPDPSWVEPDAMEPSGKTPTRQLGEYLSALFDDDDFVGYVNDSYQDDEGRWLPKKGHYTRTAGELRAELAKADSILTPWLGSWLSVRPCLDLADIGTRVDRRRRLLSPATKARMRRGFALYGSQWVMSYYGTGVGQSLDMPLRTITCKDRFALVTRRRDGDYLRMLRPDELKAAQGFPKSYVIDHYADGTPVPKAEQVKRIGNSVVPIMAYWLTCAQMWAE